MNMITRLEEAILIAILRLENNAHSEAIHQQVSQRYYQDYAKGALYFTLDQLHRKKYVNKTQKLFYHPGGRRSRTYYTLTDKALKVLQKTKDSHESLWEGIPEESLDTKKKEEEAN
jgi:DNA-binding PadR family transcriptional regulator